MRAAKRARQLVFWRWGKNVAERLTKRIAVLGMVVAGVGETDAENEEKRSPKTRESEFVLR